MTISLFESTLAALVLTVLCGAICLWALILRTRQSHLGLQYPRGPPPKGRISGNKEDMIGPRLWVKYRDWSMQYGSVLYLRSYSQPIIILNSLEDAVELFDRRSRIYSSRPQVPMYTLMGFSANTAMRFYGPEWRHHRRIFQQMFKPDASLEYRPTQTKKVHDMLLRLLNSPEDFDSHLKTLAGSIILSVMYDYDVAPKDDRFVELAEATRPAFSLGASPQWSVNNFPALRYLPDWLPGAGFKRYARAVRRIIVEQREETFKYAVSNMRESMEGHIHVVPSLLDSCRSERDIRLLQEAAATGYGAGVGTTFSTIMVFIVAMITFPDVQKKAQRELDLVTGGARLPEYADQAALPYITALVREVVRWKPITPLGLPHANTEDDTYNGYHIPKGSIIHPNVWAMTHDAKRYRDPDTFIPERFFTETGELNDDDMTYVFGFGRRICPGRHLGLATVWLAVATILAGFDIMNKRDNSGDEIPLEVKYTEDGLSSYPLAFKCSITPRSEEATQLILEVNGKV